MADVLHHLESDPTYWEVTLKDDQKVSVRATAFGEDGDDWVFVILMEGDPHYELEVARFPKSAAAEPEGGWLTPRA